MSFRTGALGAAIFIIGLAIGLGLPQFRDAATEGPGGAAEKEILYWVAPMDPNFRSDTPGKSPMGMDLVPVYAEGSVDDPAVVKLSPEVINNIGVRIARAQVQDLTPKIETVGYITYNQDETTHLHTRANGWVEKLMVRSEGEFVEKGDLLFQFFSPEISNAVYEHIRELARGNSQNARATHDKLISLGVSERQIKSLKSTSNFNQKIDFYASRSGVVTNLNAQDGMHLMPQVEALALTDLSSVWILTEVFESLAKEVFPGMAVSAHLTQIQGRQWQGVVDYIYPELDPMTRTLTLRIRIDNADHFLRPNMIADVTLQGRAVEHALTVPSEAIIQTGHSTHVVLALGNGRFRPAPVQTGLAVDGDIQILTGLSEGQEIVTSANFLIDSESNLKAGFNRMGQIEEQAMDMSAQAITAPGMINSIDMAAATINISHDPIPAIGWPAMTMDMPVAKTISLHDLTIGKDVIFELVQKDDGFYEIIAITPGAHLDGGEQ